MPYFVLFWGLFNFWRAAIMRGFYWALRNQHKRALLYYSYCICNIWGVCICIYTISYGNINIWLSLHFVIRVFDIYHLVAQHASKLHPDVYFVETSLAGIPISPRVCSFHTVYIAFNPSADVHYMSIWAPE